MQNIKPSPVELGDITPPRSFPDMTIRDQWIYAATHSFEEIDAAEDDAETSKVPPHPLKDLGPEGFFTTPRQWRSDDHEDESTTHSISYAPRFGSHYF